MVNGITGRAHPLAALIGGVRRQGDASARAANDGGGMLSPQATLRAEQALEGLRQLKQANAQRSGERKAAAKQKVERLKKEMEMLRMFGSAGDPKGLAKQAARIARELKQAVGEYMGTGGGKPVDVQAGAASTLQEPGAPVSGSEGAEAQAASSEAPPAAAAPAAPPAAPAPDSAEAREKEREALAGAYLEQAGEQSRDADRKKADMEFAGTARNLQRQIEAFIAQQRHRAEEEGREDSEFDSFSKDVQAAGAAISRLVDSLSFQSFAAAPAVDVVV